MFLFCKTCVVISFKIERNLLLAPFPLLSSFSRTSSSSSSSTDDDGDDDKDGGRRETSFPFLPTSMSLLSNTLTYTLSPLISFKYDEEPKSNITVFTFALSLSAIDDDDEQR